MTHLKELRLFRAISSPKMARTASEIINSGSIANGPAIQDFEQSFGQLVNRNHLVATSDMTNAMVLALRLIGIGNGDQVAAIAYSCLSTTSAIPMTGARPLWIDLDPTTASMCPNDLKRKITRRTKAVILYHVAGYPSDAREIAEICAHFNIPLIEDCNAAIGATVNGHKVGTFGQYAVYSFYPNRHINGLEGGALACPDAQIAMRARALRRFGVDQSKFRDSRGEIDKSQDVVDVGLSAPFSQLHAAVALTQFPGVRRRELIVRRNAQLLSAYLAASKRITVIRPLQGAVAAFWCFLILDNSRDETLLRLKSQGIQCSMLHQRNDVYSVFGGSTDVLPGHSVLDSHILALPCGWWLTKADIARIATAVLQN